MSNMYDEKHFWPENQAYQEWPLEYPIPTEIEAYPAPELDSSDLGSLTHGSRVCSYNASRYVLSEMMLAQPQSLNHLFDRRATANDFHWNTQTQHCYPESTPKDADFIQEPESTDELRSGAPSNQVTVSELDSGHPAPYEQYTYTPTAEAPPSQTLQRRNNLGCQSRLYCCSDCEEVFTRSDNLKRHIEQLHPTREHPPQVCERCKKIFKGRRAKDYLRQHQRPNANRCRTAAEPLFRNSV
ncbi:hypothetical protein ABW19_dt0204251 [Dactylella cylindrospora]|nr:hypothetical protein ABW19_dt0204251 [Dactylella cylindrospora]